MPRTIIAVVDAARARLFTADRASEGGELHDTFVETTDLVNPARRLTPAELFSDTRTGSCRTGGRHYRTDDHREAHIDVMDTEFAFAVTAAIEQAVRDAHAGRVIICAPPRMLGILRATDLPRDGVEVDELARDYAKLTPPQIHDQLIDHGLLPPPPQRAAFAHP